MAGGEVGADAVEEFLHLQQARLLLVLLLGIRHGCAM
jgi:hypothetical protein